MSFNLKNAPEKLQNTGKKYVQPGIYDNTTITEVVLLETSKNQVPYMELRTTGPNGEIGKSGKMFLNTKVGTNIDGSPKKMSAWEMTSRNILDLVQATHNNTEDQAKELFGEVSSNQQVVDKTAALLVGKVFRGKFKGETDPNGRIWPSLDKVESMKVTPTQLRFDITRDVKAYQGAPQNNNAEPIVPVNGNEDLPF